MNKTALLVLGVIMLTVSGVGLLYASFTMSHITTGHVTITSPPPPTPSGNFTIPADFTFPSIQQGQSTTHVIHVTSQLNVPVTVTAHGTGIDGLTVTGGPVSLSAGGSCDVTLNLSASGSATIGSLDVPVTFTVTP
jgi:hypothetical protein